MATRDLEENYQWEYRALDPPETFLPIFPDHQSICSALPELRQRCVPLGKIHFVPWVDFTLENPDEIWEISRTSGEKSFYYVNFVEKDAAAPAFVVDVFCADDVMEVDDFSLVVDNDHLGLLRCGDLVYSRAREWEKDQLVRALNDQALSKYDEDRLDEARDLIDLAIGLSETGSAYLFNNRGLICWKMGRTDQAKRDFLECISRDPGNGDPYFNIGLIYFDEADYVSALHYLRGAVDTNPADSQFLTELGHLYLELEREDEALKLFTKATESDPADPQVDFHLGYYFLYKKRQPKDAIRYYDNGLRKDPQDQFALADLALAHWAIGNRRKTLEINGILEGNPRLAPYTISRLVYLNLELGDYETALKYYRQALSHNEPFEPEWLHYHAALVYAKTGRPRQALDTLNLAVRVGGEAVVKRAMSDKALQPLKRTADFKKLMKLPARRRNR